jgi:hypothetical protein
MRARLLALAALVGCRATPEQRPLWRESWELIAPTDDGGLLDARVTVGNTGVLAGQGHLRLDRWRGDDSPVNFARMASPDESGVWPERDRVRVGPDRLGVERRGWTLRVNDDEASAVVHLETTGGPSPEQVSTEVQGGTWTMSVPLASGEVAGWLEAGSRGGALGGQGVLTWRGGDGLPGWPRRAVYIIGGGETSVGLDEHGGARMAWGRVGGRDLVMDDAALKTGPDGELVLDLRPAEDIAFTLVPRTTGGTTDPFERLSTVEKQALRALGGPPVRRVQLLQARVLGTPTALRVPAVLVEVAAPENLLDIEPRRRPR